MDSGSTVAEAALAEDFSKSGLYLRYRINDLGDSWQAIVRDGAMASLGMPARGEFVSEREAEAIKAYVIEQARLGHERGEKRLVPAR